MRRGHHQHVSIGDILSRTYCQTVHVSAGASKSVEQTYNPAYTAFELGSGDFAIVTDDSGNLVMVCD